MCNKEVFPATRTRSIRVSRRRQIWVDSRLLKCSRIGPNVRAGRKTEASHDQRRSNYLYPECDFDAVWRFRRIFLFVLVLNLMSAANNLFTMCWKTVRVIHLLPEFENSIQWRSP